MSVNANAAVQWQSASGLSAMGPFFEGEITPDVLMEVYPLLQYPMPESAIQRTSKAQTHKAYDTTGVGYQFAVNRMNEVLGPGHWQILQNILKEFEGSWGTPPKPNYSLTVETEVRIGNWVNGEFVPIHKVYGIGGHTGTDWADTLKGAQTNSLKKALGFLGVGREAYEGTLDDDNRGYIDGDNGQPQTPNTSSASSNAGQQRNQSRAGNTQNQARQARASQGDSQGIPIPSTPPADGGTPGTPIPSTPPAQGGAKGASANNATELNFFTGQVVLIAEPVKMTPGGKVKVSAKGVIVDDNGDTDVTIVGWNENAEEVMKLHTGSVIEINNAYLKNTERYGIEISLKTEQYQIVA